MKTLFLLCSIKDTKIVSKSTIPQTGYIKNKQMIISEKAKKAIMDDVKVRAALMTAFSMSEKSVQNWVGRNEVKLTTPKAVEVIRNATGLTESQILVKEKQTA